VSRGPGGGIPGNDDVPAGSGWAGPRRAPYRERRRRAKASGGLPLAVEGAKPSRGSAKILPQNFYFFFLAIFSYYFWATFSTNFVPKCFLKKLSLFFSHIFL
jgi:hypothetical protein